LYFYFSGLSLRGSSQILFSQFIKQNPVSIWNRIQKYKPKRLSSRKKRVWEFVVDEALLKQVQGWHGFDGWWQLSLSTRKFSQ
jgi:hypothetical protein